MDLQARIKQGSSPADIADYLDNLPHQERPQANHGAWAHCTTQTFSSHAKRPLPGLTHFVPEDRADMEEVIHWGRNTLPAFTRFQKRFCRPRPEEVGSQQVLWGYNQQRLRRITGPGYFHARNGEQDTPVWIDYRGEPPIGRSPHGLASFTTANASAVVIYYGTIDKCAASPSTSPSVPLQRRQTHELVVHPMPRRPIRGTNS